MSEVNKDNKKFEFIKEQILPKKRKKFRKWFIPFLMTIFMAIIFGLVAALTFCVTEPRLYSLLHKDSDNPFSLPSPTPSDPYDKDNNIGEENPKENPDESSDENPDTNPYDNHQPTATPIVDGANEQNDIIDEQNSVIIKSIDADTEDFISMYSDIMKIRKEMSKSVLTVSSIIDGKDWFGNPIEKRIYSSGVIVEKNDENIMLLVSLDRVRAASSIKIELNDTLSVDATIHDYESELNLAIISINSDDVPIKTLNMLSVANMGESYTLSVGSPIIAMGSPNGYPQSVDMGIITSIGSIVSITDYELDLFNTNILFNSESDGIIVNLKGEVIGLITRTLKRDLNKELSTIVGISEIKSYIDRMISQTPRIYTGIIAENIPQTGVTSDTTRGVYIYEVRKDSPAFNAGLMSGDIILSVGHRVVINMSNYYSAISSYEPGAEVIFKIKRTSHISDKEMEIKVVLEEKKQ